MTAYTFSKATATDLATLKQQYLQQLPAPQDGMWEYFTALGDHFTIQLDDEVIGYYVVNAERQLLQFHVAGSHAAGPVFSQILAEAAITGAVAATSEPLFLALCLDHQKSVAVHARLYHVKAGADIRDAAFPPHAQFNFLGADELGTAVDFANLALGADRDWLQGYYGNLIKRRELFGLWLDHGLIATGECRVSDTQAPYADLGVVVAENHRGRGLATAVLRQLLHQCRDRGLHAICSTESDNLAAQKAITRSGFASHHRILEFQFDGADNQS